MSPLFESTLMYHLVVYLEYWQSKVYSLNKLTFQLTQHQKSNLAVHKLVPSSSKMKRTP